MRTGMGIRQYHTRRRSAESARLLRETTMKFSQTADRMGCRDPLCYGAVFKRARGTLPRRDCRRYPPGPVKRSHPAAFVV